VIREKCGDENAYRATSKQPSVEYIIEAPYVRFVWYSVL